MGVISIHIHFIHAVLNYMLASDCFVLVSRLFFFFFDISGFQGVTIFFFFIYLFHIMASDLKRTSSDQPGDLHSHAKVTTPKKKSIIIVKKETIKAYLIYIIVS